MTALRGPLRVDCSAATGAIFDHGAQVTAWRPSGADEVLWLSDSSAFDSTSAIRGGIPICFPWFGAGRDGRAKPSHGFARLSAWSLADVTESHEAVTVTHSLSSSAATAEAFPHEFLAVHSVRFGERLDVHLSVENTGAAPFSYEAALHTYLRVGDVRQVRVAGLDGVQYIDQVDSNAVKTQSGEITFTGETDRVYLGGGGVDVMDAALNRTIRVRMSGTSDTVVWNPWRDRAAALSDFGDDAWPGMVCIEGANVRSDAIDLMPGAVHVMGYQLSVADGVSPSG